MSDRKESARLIYERTENGAKIEMRGTRDEPTDALVRLTCSVAERTGMDVARFGIALPALIALDKARLAGSTAFDMAAILKAKEGDTHE